eukprot:7252906-Pyramimonas_sp.AAC.1
MAPLHPGQLGAVGADTWGRADGDDAVGRLLPCGVVLAYADEAGARLVDGRVREPPLAVGGGERNRGILAVDALHVQPLVLEVGEVDDAVVH